MELFKEHRSPAGWVTGLLHSGVRHPGSGFSSETLASAFKVKCSVKINEDRPNENRQKLFIQRLL